MNNKDKMQANQKEILKEFKLLEKRDTDYKRNPITKKQMKSIRSLYGLDKDYQLDISRETADKIINDGINKIKKESYNYIKYMDNHKKVNAKPFNLNSLNMTEEEVENVTEEFNKSSEKGSILFKGVFSFEEQYLEENKILEYDGDGKKILNQDKLKKAGIMGMEKIIENNSMNINNVNTFATIHLNTSHPHIHIAICEKEPNTEKGKITPNAIKISKRAVANNLEDHTELYQQLDKYILKTKEELYNDIDKNLDELLNIKIPKQGRTSFNKLDKESEFYCHVNNYLETFIRENNSYDEFIKYVDKIDKRNKDSYGKVKENNYKNNKVDKLKSTLGNIVIKELKGINKTHISNDKKQYVQKFNKKLNIQLNKNINQYMKLAKQEEFERKRKLNENYNDDIIERYEIER